MISANQAATDMDYRHTRDHRGFATRLNAALDAIGAPPLYKGRIDFLRRLYHHASGEHLAAESIRRWLNGDAIPQTARIEQLVRILEVDGEYLLTGRGSDAIADHPSPATVDNDETALLYQYRQLSPRERKIARRIIAQMADPPED